MSRQVRQNYYNSGRVNSKRYTYHGRDDEPVQSTEEIVKQVIQVINGEDRDTKVLENTKALYDKQVAIRSKIVADEDTAGESTCSSQTQAPICTANTRCNWRAGRLYGGTCEIKQNVLSELASELTIYGDMTEPVSMPWLFPKGFDPQRYAREFPELFALYQSDDPLRLSNEIQRRILPEMLRSTFETLFVDMVRLYDRSWFSSLRWVSAIVNNRQDRFWTHDIGTQLAIFYLFWSVQIANKAPNLADFEQLYEALYMPIPFYIKLAAIRSVVQSKLLFTAPSAKRGRGGGLVKSALITGVLLLMLANAPALLQPAAGAEALAPQRPMATYQALNAKYMSEAVNSEIKPTVEPEQKLSQIFDTMTSYFRSKPAAATASPPPPPIVALHAIDQEPEWTEDGHLKLPIVNDSLDSLYDDLNLVSQTGKSNQVYRAIRKTDRQPVKIESLSLRVGNNPQVAELKIRIRRTIDCKPEEECALLEIYHWWTSGDKMFIESKWIDGGTGSDVIDRTIGPEPGTAQEFELLRSGLRTISHTLDKMHLQGIYQRNIQPDLILYDKNDERLFMEISADSCMNAIDEQKVGTCARTYPTLVTDPVIALNKLYKTNLPTSLASEDIYDLGTTFYQLLTHNQEPVVLYDRGRLIGVWREDHYEDEYKKQLDTLAQFADTVAGRPFAAMFDLIGKMLYPLGIEQRPSLQTIVATLSPGGIVTGGGGGYTSRRRKSPTQTNIYSAGRLHRSGRKS